LAIVAGCGFTPGVGMDDGDDATLVFDAPVLPIDAPSSDVDATIVSIDATVDATVDATIDATVDAAASDCPFDYVITSNASKYRLVPSNANWLSAQNDCANDGAFTHLVVANDAAELAVVDQLVDGTAWIGASDRTTEGTWRAVTGGVAPHLPWADNQPDDFFGEDCAEYYESGAFNDVDCGVQHPYVCECDGTPPDPSSY
jgi:hypothetical protein